MQNTAKPTTTLNNSTRISNAETWATIATTWTTETRTWAECASLLVNEQKAYISSTEITTIDRSPSTVSQTSSLFVGTWNNPTNVFASDNALATVTSNRGTQTLIATNFGFTIPSNAVIRGVTVKIERRHAGGVMATTQDSSVRLYKEGSAVGDNKAKSDTWPQGGDTIATYGSTSNMWGVSLSSDDINSSGFGVGISALCSDTTAIPSIDHITIAVTYQENVGVITNTPKP